MASVFSGKAGRNAAIWTAQQAQNSLAEQQALMGAGRSQAEAALTGSFKPSIDFLQDYYAQGRKDLAGGLTGANKNINTGMTKGVGALNSNYAQAIAAANNFYGQGAGALNRGVEAFQPLIDQNMAGFQMYQNSLGLGGAEGTAAAQNAFQAGPGYQWNVDQATSQAARAANKLGMTYSGNTVDAQTRLAQNLANQEYGNWQKNLQGFQAGAQNAVTGQSGMLSNLANLYGNQAGTISGLEQAQGRDLATLYEKGYGQIGQNIYNTGNTQAQMAANQGANLAQLQTGYGQSMAGTALGYMQGMLGANSNFYQTVIPAGQQGMMAGQQAAANRTGAMLGVAQMGMQALGGAAGGGAGLFSKLFG